MCNTGFVVVPRTITQSAYSCLAATAVSSVVVETDIGSFIINTVTLACISLGSAVGSAKDGESLPASDWFKININLFNLDPILIPISE